jgi:uncharacterized protein YodC (DUF2158 family)
MEDLPAFTIGDVVTLKTGGIKMTVRRVHNGDVTVNWFVGDKFHEKIYPLAMLVKVG